MTTGESSEDPSGGPIDNLWIRLADRSSCYRHGYTPDDAEHVINNTWVEAWKPFRASTDPYFTEDVDTFVGFALNSKPIEVCCQWQYWPKRGDIYTVFHIEDSDDVKMRTLRSNGDKSGYRRRVL